MCTSRGIKFSVVSPHEPLHDSVYGYKIRATPPKLAHCLFYQPILVAGLRLYPPEFVKKSGLKKIVLCGDLHYLSQPRKAIPVDRSGTLYLDSGPEIVYYMQNVLHHEYFHIIDMAIKRHGCIHILTHQYIPVCSPARQLSLACCRCLDQFLKHCSEFCCFRGNSRYVCYT